MIWRNMKKKTELLTKAEDDFRYGFALNCFIMLSLVVVMYWKYLVGVKTYIFMDIGCDSVDQFYPNLVYLAREIASGNFTSRWNFSNSIGNAESMILPKLSNIEAFFGQNNIPYLMGLFQAIKVFLSGTFFYLYLKKMNISSMTSSIFSMFYAFCAQMIIRGSWRSYPNEVLTFAIWLYAFETWFHDKKKIGWILVASCFFYYNASGYLVVLYSGIFVVYSMFRYFSEDSKTEQESLLKGIMPIVITISLALCISSFSWIDNIATLVKSDRFSGGVDKIYSQTFSDLFTDVLTLKTAFFRTVSMDAIGINDYLGKGNFLKDPAFYCGVLTLILLPTMIILAQGRKKIWYCIGIIGIALYIFVKPVRYLLNGFSEYNTFKLSSLWVMVLMLHICAIGFDGLFENKEKLKVKYIVVSCAVLIALSLVCTIDGMDYSKRNIVILFMIGYLVLIFGYKKSAMTVTSFKSILLAVVCIEVFIMAYGCINNRRTMDEENVYNDGTQEALALIDESENEIFYRIDKLFYAASFCDSLYQDFMGTIGYIGGSGDRNSTGDFYKALAMPIIAPNNHDMLGFSTSTPINTLMNVKYILSKSGLHTNFGYEEIGTIEGIHIYKNMYSLPFGYVYDKYMTFEDYMSLSVMERRKAMMSMCVLDAKNDVLQEAAYTEGKISLEPYKVDYTQEQEETWITISFPATPEGYVSVIEMDVECTKAQNEWYIYYDDNGVAQNSYYAFSAGKDIYFLEFNKEGTSQVRINGINNYLINEMSIYQVPKSIYYKDYIDAQALLCENGMQVKEMDCNTILGTINSDKSGMITFSIPYDKSWNVYIDGKRQELQTVNIGMMGTTITEGEHEIELTYEKKTYMKTTIIGMVILLIIAVGVRIREKRRNIIKGGKQCIEYQ